MLEQRGNDRGDQQHIDQQVVELARKADQQAVLVRGGQAVRAELHQTARRFVRRQSRLIRSQHMQHFLHWQVVPTMWVFWFNFRIDGAAHFRLSMPPRYYLFGSPLTWYAKQQIIWNILLQECSTRFATPSELLSIP